MASYSRALSLSPESARVVQVPQAIVAEAIKRTAGSPGPKGSNASAAATELALVARGGGADHVHYALLSKEQVEKCIAGGTVETTLVPAIGEKKNQHTHKARVTYAKLLGSYEAVIVDHPEPDHEHRLLVTSDPKDTSISRESIASYESGLSRWEKEAMKLEEEQRNAAGKGKNIEGDGEKAEREKAEKEKAEKEKADREKADREKADREKADREKADREKAEKEKAEREKAEKDKLEKEKAEKEKAEKEKLEKEKLEKEKQDAEREKKKGPAPLQVKPDPPVIPNASLASPSTDTPKPDDYAFSLFLAKGNHQHEVYVTHGDLKKIAAGEIVMAKSTRGGDNAHAHVVTLVHGAVQFKDKDQAANSHQHQNHQHGQHTDITAIVVGNHGHEVYRDQLEAEVATDLERKKPPVVIRDLGNGLTLREDPPVLPPAGADTPEATQDAAPAAKDLHAVLFLPAGTADHEHTVYLTKADFEKLSAGEFVPVRSTHAGANAHAHTVQLMLKGPAGPGASITGITIGNHGHGDLTASQPPPPEKRGLRNYRAGLARLETGDSSGAILLLTRAVEEDPADVNILYDRALAFCRDKEYTSAIADFNEVLRTDPRYLNAYIGKGFVNRRLGNTEEAITDYTEALRIDPNCTQAFLNRGVCHRELNHLAKAQADYTSAIATDAGCLAALTNRGLLFFELEKYEEARADLTACLEIRKEPRILKTRGIILNELGRYDEAIRDFKQSFALYRDPEVQNLLVEVEENKKLMAMGKAKKKKAVPQTPQPQ